MPVSIGIRREDKSIWERRTPITPAAAQQVLRQHQVQVMVQPSAQRAFSAAEFEIAGATMQEVLAECPIVFGIKEIPADTFVPGQAYMFFAHVIKGQAYNMPMLQTLLDLGCTLIDYEKVTDDAGRRLIFFGWHAGVAGMLETLRALGQRLAVQGIANPFSALRRAYDYHDINEARQAVVALGQTIRSEGLPAEMMPLVIGVAGYGNVARGAWEILDLLPVERITPEQLADLAARPRSSHTLYATTFHEQHMAAPLEPGAMFDLQEYYTHPERYRAAFETYLPHLSVLVNAIYWEPRYPRLITKDYLRWAWDTGNSRLLVIGDISCDIDGAIECTVKSTEPGEPDFVYHPLTGAEQDGVEGEGVLVMAVDILPAELPRDASDYFAGVLLPYVPALAAADYSVSFDDLMLPPEIKRAVIVHRGKLTPSYAYLQDHLTDGGR